MDRLLKAILYRLLNMVIAFGISYIFIQSVSMSIKFSVIDCIVRTSIYYLYDWAWDYIKNSR